MIQWTDVQCAKCNNTCRDKQCVLLLRKEFESVVQF